MFSENGPIHDINSGVEGRGIDADGEFPSPEDFLRALFPSSSLEEIIKRMVFTECEYAILKQEPDRLLAFVLAVEHIAEKTEGRKIFLLAQELNSIRVVELFRPPSQTVHPLVHLCSRLKIRKGDVLLYAP